MTDFNLDIGAVIKRRTTDTVSDGLKLQCIASAIFSSFVSFKQNAKQRITRNRQMERQAVLSSINSSIEHRY